MHYIITLKNAREIIQADNLCRSNALNTKIITIPTDLSSACGMAISVETNDLQTVLQLLTTHCLTPKTYERQ